MRGSIGCLWDGKQSLRPGQTALAVSFPREQEQLKCEKAVSIEHTLVVAAQYPTLMLCRSGMSGPPRA